MKLCMISYTTLSSLSLSLLTNASLMLYVARLEILILLLMKWPPLRGSQLLIVQCDLGVVQVQPFQFLYSLCFEKLTSRAVIAVQRGAVPEWRVYQQHHLPHHHGDLSHLLGVHHQVRHGQRLLCFRLRSVLCGLHLHLWLLSILQHHLHQEPGLPQQLHSHQR